jgi:hypothetical protein
VVGLLVGAVPRWFLDREQDRAQQMGTDSFKRAVSVGESESLLREEIEGKRRLYTTLAESVSRGEVRFVDAGHVTMHFRRPDAVVQAIEDMLSRRIT